MRRSANQPSLLLLVKHSCSVPTNGGLPSVAAPQSLESGRELLVVKTVFVRTKCLIQDRVTDADISF
jgi:hypothetical protein